MNRLFGVGLCQALAQSRCTPGVGQNFEQAPGATTPQRGLSLSLVANFLCASPCWRFQFIFLQIKRNKNTIFRHGSIGFYFPLIGFIWIDCWAAMPGLWAGIASRAHPACAARFNGGGR
ncbi:MAG: hypothetical protein Q4A97_10240 [Comamonadaceae bacterium]|nr:hypothetical protein [Comamonadaceae bacterium]